MKNKKIYLTLGLIFLILMVTHYRWFFNFSILTAGDWGFYFKETQREFLRLPSFWDSRAFGMPNVGISMYPVYLLWGILSSIFNFTLIERILYLWPSIIIAGFGSYFLIRKITKSNLAALVGSFVFVYNTYFFTLKLSQLTLAVSFALAPVIILFFIKALEEKKYYFAILAGIFSFVSSFYEFRAFYLILLILFLYFLYHSFIIEKLKLKQFFKNGLLAFTPIFLVLMLNFYWLFGLARTGILVNNEIFSRGLFGNFMNISRALTLFHPFWTGGKIDVFVVQKIPFYFWLIPVFAFLGLWLNRKNKQILFFGFIALIGILLTKQTVLPFPNLYQWLYSNFPGFNAFRESSKFYFMIVLGYSVLIGAFIAWLWRSWNKQRWQVWGKYFLLFLISFIFLWNAKPIITGEFDSMFIARHVPNDYLILKNFILRQDEYFRTFWVPRDSRWGIEMNNHPKVNSAAMTDSIWKDFTRLTQINSNWPSEQTVEILKKPDSKRLFDSGSIKYVIVPLEDKENDDDFFVSYGNERDFYIKELDKIDYLEKIDIGAKDLVIYENKDYKPHLYQTQERDSIYKDVPFTKVDFQFINPTQYQIKLKNIKQPVYFNFSEAFNPDWQLRIGNFNWYKALISRNYFLPNEYHFINEIKLNSYYLDPEFIKKNYPGEYQENPDGSIDMDMTLYFQPQSYFYLGLIISGTALIGCLGFLIYYWKKRKTARCHPEAEPKDLII